MTGTTADICAGSGSGRVQRQVGRVGTRLPSERLSFQDKRHLHGNPVFRDFSIVHARFFLKHVKSGDPPQCFVRPYETFLDGGIKLAGEAAVIFVTLAIAISAS